MTFQCQSYHGCFNDCTLRFDEAVHKRFLFCSSSAGSAFTSALSCRAPPPLEQTTQSHQSVAVRLQILNISGLWQLQLQPRSLQVLLLHHRPPIQRCDGTFKDSLDLLNFRLLACCTNPPHLQETLLALLASASEASQPQRHPPYIHTKSHIDGVMNNSCRNNAMKNYKPNFYFPFGIKMHKRTYSPSRYVYAPLHVETTLPLLYMPWPFRTATQKTIIYYGTHQRALSFMTTE